MAPLPRHNLIDIISQNRIIFATAGILLVIIFSFFLVPVDQLFKMFFLLAVAIALSFLSYSTHLFILLIFIFLPAYPVLTLGGMVLRTPDLYIPYIWFLVFFKFPFVLKEATKRDPWSYAFLFLFFVIFVSSVKTFYILGFPTFSKSIVHIYRFISFLSCFYLFKAFFQDSDSIKKILYFFMCVMTAHVFFGLTEFAAHSIFGVNYLWASVFRLEQYFAGGVYLNPFEFRVAGIFGAPENFGQNIALLLPICLNIFWYPGIRGRVFFSIIIFLSFLVLLLTGTRAGALEFMIALFVLSLLIRHRKNIYTLFFAVLSLIFVSYLGSTFWMRAERLIAGGEMSAITYRIQSWKTAWVLFKSDPFLGTGWGSYGATLIKKFPYIMNEVKIPMIADKAEYIRSVGDMFLLSLCELGIIGFISFVIIWFLTLYTSFKNYINIKDITYKRLSVTLLMTFLIYLLSNYFGTVPLFYIHGGHYLNAALFFIFLALLSKMSNLAKLKEDSTQ